MTTIDATVLKQALKALEYHAEQTRPIESTTQAIAALRTALLRLRQLNNQPNR